MIKTQTELREAFWRDNPELAKQRVWRKKQNEYPTDTRLAWCDYVGQMARSEQITNSLAQKATL